MRKERRLKTTQDSEEKVCSPFPSNHTARVHSLADPRNGFKLFNVAKNSLKINSLPAEKVDCMQKPSYTNDQEMTGLSLIYTSQHAGVAFKYYHHYKRAL